MNIKTHSTYLIIISALILAMIIIFQFGIDRHQRVESLQSANESLTSELVTYRNENGKLISQVQAAEIQLRDLPEKIERQIRDQFDVKRKNIRGYSSTSFVAKGSGKATVRPIHHIEDGSDGTPKWETLPGSDSIIFSTGSSLISDSDLTFAEMTLNLTHYTRPDGSAYYVEYGGDTVEVSITNLGPYFPQQGFMMIADDGYLNFQAEIYEEGETPYQYSYSDTVTQVFSLKGKFLQKKKLYSQAMLSNPNAQIINHQAVLVKEAKDKRWGIGPHVGIGFSGDGIRPCIGVALQYSFIKF